MKNLQNIFTPTTITAGLIFGGIIVIAKLFMPDKEQKKKAGADAKQLQNDVKQLEQQGMKPSHTQSNYNMFADRLYQAMNTSGTNETPIYNVFKSMKNEIDVLRLIEAYGTRQLYVFGVAVEGKQTLPQAIQSELDSSEINEVNKILFTKGINFKF